MKKYYVNGIEITENEAKAIEAKNAEYMNIMKSDAGTLDERELKARRRFWNKKGFFGEPTKKAIERGSMRMQKLVKAMQGYTAEDIRRINKAPYYSSVIIRTSII